MLSIFYKGSIFRRLLFESAGRGLLLFRVVVFFLLIVPLPFAVSCSQQQMARLRAEVERRNAASLEREYQSFIEENRRSHARLQQALAVASRAELRHADCAANECWCSGGKLSPVRLSPEEWSQMRDILRRVRPSLQPHRESLVLPDEDFNRLYSLPSCRGFLKLMPDDWNNFFR